MKKYAGCISKNRIVLFSLALISIQITASSRVQAMGRGHVVVTATPTPAPSTGNATQPIDGAGSCTMADPDHICIGLKMVAYQKNSASVISRAQAIKVVQEISTVWSQCNIGFQLETFEELDPTTKGLSYNSNWSKDGDMVRKTFNDNASFLVVDVGELSGSTIGVTEMPGTGIYGSLIENSYATNALTVGHELGHYQGLYHVSSNANLMYAYIGDHTATLSAAQCTTARQTDLANWRGMMRH